MLRQLTQRFGALSSETTQQIEATDQETLERYLDRMPVASSLDEVLQ